MSARNGDKSRFHRLRKAKIRRRIRTELLQSLVTTEKSQPAPVADATSEPPAPGAREKSSIGPLAAAAQSIGMVLGAVAAKTGIAHKAEPAE